MKNKAPLFLLLLGVALAAVGDFFRVNFVQGSETLFTLGLVFMVAGALYWFLTRALFKNLFK